MSRGLPNLIEMNAAIELYGSAVVNCDIVARSWRTTFPPEGMVPAQEPGPDAVRMTTWKGATWLVLEDVERRAAHLAAQEIERDLWKARRERP